MRTRYIDAQKGFIGLGHEKSGDPYWADVYDGRFGHVIFGHQPFLEGVKYFNHATGIDTGASFWRLSDCLDCRGRLFKPDCICRE